MWASSMGYLLSKAKSNLLIYPRGLSSISMQKICGWKKSHEEKFYKTCNIFSFRIWATISNIATSPFFHDYLLRDLLHYCHPRSKGIFKPYVGLYVGFNVCVCVYIYWPFVCNNTTLSVISQLKLFISFKDIICHW